MRKHLGKLRIEIENLDNLDDGVLLIMVMAILEDYFIPEYAFISKPSNFDEKLTNCKFLFELIDEVCHQEKNCNPEGSVLFSFLKFKN